MALGGGTFIAQDKKLPGAYINFKGVAKAFKLSDRGTAAVALSLPWGELGKVFTVTKDRVHRDSKKLFGYDYNAPEMYPVRELFMGASKLFVYRLGTEGAKATNTLADAKYVGTAGNKIITTVTKTTDGENPTGWAVRTYFDGELVDEQQAGTSDNTDVLLDNDFVIWKSGVTLAETTKTTGMMKSGTDPTAELSHGKFLTALQTKTFQTVACGSSDETIVKEYVEFVKSMRESYGIKCQAVVYNIKSDYEGIINVKNPAENKDAFALVYWVAGVEAGCPVNESCTNKVYDGELTVKADYTQDELEDALDQGFFVMHLVDDDVRVLDDINSLITFDDVKTEDFASNQSIRVLDQIATDVRMIFSKRYIGLTPNDTAGREAFWNDIVTICRSMQDIRAIEDFSADSVEVSPGEKKKAVEANFTVKPVNAMAQLYCTVQVA